MNQYQHTNSKGTTYYLNRKVTERGATIYFFSKDAGRDSALAELPEGKEVRENERTGMLLIAKKA